jgi:hypothetical protein
MIRRRKPISRSVTRKRFSPPKKTRRKFSNPAYLEWLRAWPCFICFKKHCDSHDISFWEAIKLPGARELFREIRSRWDCGRTEAAHVGVKGTAQRCPDIEAMPLGTRHHVHPTAGGAQDSHHAGTRVFWEKHGLVREHVLATLQKLYESETGRVLQV